MQGPVTGHGRREGVIGSETYIGQLSPGQISNNAHPRNILKGSEVLPCVNFPGNRIASGLVSDVQAPARAGLKRQRARTRTVAAISRTVPQKRSPRSGRRLALATLIRRTGAWRLTGSMTM